MPWIPTYSVINSRAIAENLLTYFEANQVDALNWANSGTDLKAFQRIEDSVDNLDEPFFPAIMFSQDNDAAIYTETLPAGTYAVMFELMVTDPDPNDVITKARKYEKAVKSMVRNCPQATYAANTAIDTDSAVLVGIEAGFDPVLKHLTQQYFLQRFQVRATYQFHAADL